jgi:hypothetical protein
MAADAFGFTPHADVRNPRLRSCPWPDVNLLMYHKTAAPTRIQIRKCTCLCRKRYSVYIFQRSDCREVVDRTRRWQSIAV